MVDFALQMWALHSSFFGKIPYKMLLSSIEHPHLTVDRLAYIPKIVLIQPYAIYCSNDMAS